MGAVSKRCGETSSPHAAPRAGTKVHSRAFTFLVVALGLGAASYPARGALPGSSAIPRAVGRDFSSAAQEQACLTQARLAIERYRGALDRAHSWLAGASLDDRDLRRVARGRALSEGGPFREFEGRWRGVWAGMPVRHIWLSVEPSLQLVAILDGDERKRAVNVQGVGGFLCGLVIDAAGRERPHAGRRFGSPDTRGGIVWRSGELEYVERIVPDRGAGRRYEIRAFRWTDGHRREHHAASYREVPWD